MTHAMSLQRKPFEGKKTIGIIGGGQLCLMMGEAIEKEKLPYSLIALDPNRKCPARKVIYKQIIEDYKDEAKIRKLAERSEVITFEIESANSQVLTELSEKGIPVHPSPQTLKIIQDKYTQAEFLTRHDILVPDFQEIIGKKELEKAVEEYGYPFMVKATTDSYDGRGNYVVKEQEDIDKVLSHFSGRSLMAQRYIQFAAELSVICARGINGDIATFPVGENIHGKSYNILEATIVPARVSKDVVYKAKEVAKNTMAALEGVGVFAIEMFVTGKEDVLINEIAPRVHNSGHYTIEACYTSQFEQHLRAIAGDNLGDTNLKHKSVVMYNINGQEGFTGNYEITFRGAPKTGTTQILPGVWLHNYGKDEVKLQRKMGHFTVIGYVEESQKELIERAEQLQKEIHIREIK